MSHLTAELSEDDLRAYRAVQRVMHGLVVTLFDMRGSALSGRITVTPCYEYLEVPTVYSEEVRVVFEIGAHTWTEVHKGVPAWPAPPVRMRGRRGGWAHAYRFRIPMPR